MSDYIKRDDAIEYLIDNMVWMDADGIETSEEDKRDAIAELINGVPSDDVTPVRHGRWIKITPSGIYECSKCGKYVMTCEIEAYKYCQSCGARMDGDNNAFI